MTIIPSVSELLHVTRKNCVYCGKPSNSFLATWQSPFSNNGQRKIHSVCNNCCMYNLRIDSCGTSGFWLRYTLCIRLSAATVTVMIMKYNGAAFKWMNDVSYWFFVVEEDHIIELEFRGRFNIEGRDCHMLRSSYIPQRPILCYCQYDFLELWDGPFSYSPLIGKNCSFRLPIESVAFGVLLHVTPRKRWDTTTFWSLSLSTNFQRNLKHQNELFLLKREA